MSVEIVWDDFKRESNLEKHGLDFIDAPLVLESPFRLDVEVVRSGEKRTQSIAYVFDVLTVLTVVHTLREDSLRIISFRTASELERSLYHQWLEEDFVGDET